jgi:hypothetical protein
MYGDDMNFSVWSRSDNTATRKAENATGILKQWFRN